MADIEYLNHILQQAQAILSNEKFRNARLDLSGDALLAQLGHKAESILDGVDNLISIAFRLEYIAIRLWLDDEAKTTYYQEAKRLFESAAKLFEYVVEVQPITSDTVRLDLYLHSAVCFSVGEFQANSTVLARKVFEQFTFDDNKQAQVQKATFRLLLRDVLQLETSVAEITQNRDAFEGSLLDTIANLATRDNAIEDLAHFITLEALLNFGRYLRTGQNELYNIAQSKIENSLELFKTIRDPDNYVLTQLISLLIRQIHFSSLWYQLGDGYGFREIPILNRYIQVLINDKKPIYELWQSQIEALDKIFKDNRAVVLQMPTSAGKTRVAELKIIHTLATQVSPTRCIYIAPFKSLAVQVANTLDDYLSKVGYQVTSISGSYESVAFEDILAKQSDVLIITPEKLDYLLRQDKEFLATVKLIVVDEGHLLDNDVRGLRLEFLLERLRRTFLDLRIVFISAVVPNSGEISAWLNQGEPIVVTSEWKPTQLRQGIFHWGNDWIGRIRYPNDEFDIITSIQRQTIKTHYKNNSNKALKSPKYYPSTKYEIAIELALDFLKAKPIIIFTVVRNHVDSIAKTLSKCIQQKRVDDKEFHLAPQKRVELEHLAEKIERRLGHDFPLAQYIREGFAYHHGRVPDDLRQLIEDAFKHGYLPILITTPTLAQGINLPVHLMIVANLEMGGNSRFQVRDFRNIAGRAGRALNETEGQVIFIQNTQSHWLPNETYHYLRDDKMERLQSVLFKLYEELMQLIHRKPNKSLLELLDFPYQLNFIDDEPNFQKNIELDLAFQTQILALLYEELLNEVEADTVEKTLDKTLFGEQCKFNRIHYEPLIDYTKRQVKYISTQFKSQAQKQAFYRTGFCLKSCQDLEIEVRKLAAEGVFGQLRDSPFDELRHDVLIRIFSLILIPQEVRKQRYDGGVNLAEVMMLWINFSNINDIVAKYGEIDTKFKDPLWVSNLIYGYFTNDAPWVLNAVQRILLYLREAEDINFDPEMEYLPSYLKYGVNTQLSAFISSMGISDRNVAHEFSEAYLEGSDLPLLETEKLLDWISNLTSEDLSVRFQDNEIIKEIMSVLSRYNFTKQPVTYFANPKTIDLETYVVGLHYENRLKYLSNVTMGNILELVRETENPFDAYAMSVQTISQQKLGYIPRNMAFILSTLYDEGTRFLCRVKQINSNPRKMNEHLLVRITAH